MVAAAQTCALPDSSIYSEAVIPIADVRKKHPSAPIGPTLYWWAKRGCINRFTKQRIYLEVIYLPVGLATSYDAITRFYKALNSQVPVTGPAISQSPSVRPSTRPGLPAPPRKNRTKKKPKKT